MPNRTIWSWAFASLAALLLTACASLQGRDPLQVMVAGVEPLPGQGMELRLLVKLRVQNPNDTPIDYDGVALTMNVQGKTFATGVSAATGSVPRFGETVISVPMTISTLRLLRQALGAVQNEAPDKLRYEVKGKLSSPSFRAHRFSTSGEFAMPTPQSGESL